MAHSLPERNLYIGDTDDEIEIDVEEEGGGDVYDSDLSETISNDTHDSVHDGTRPGSYTTSWPQSYRFFFFSDFFLGSSYSSICSRSLVFCSFQDNQ